MTDHSITKPLDSELRQRLFFLIQKHGEKPVSQRVGVSRTAMMRALAGLPTFGSTRIAVRVGVEALEASHEVAQ